MRKLTLPMIAAMLLSAGQAMACTADYTVQRGDTLTSIAEDQLGSIFAFGSVYQANRAAIGPNPNLIHAGDRLTIPCELALGEINWSVMPGPVVLAHLMQQSDIQVLDIREPEQVAQGVIPGALSVPYALWRGPEENLGEPPSPAQLARLIGGSGLHLDRPIIVVHDRDEPMQTGASAVVYWILKSAGAGQLAILRGGFAGWERARLPVANRPATPEPYGVVVDLAWDWRADEVTVYGIASGQTPGHLLDARPHDMFSRFDTIGRALASTIPGAQSLPAPPLMAALSGEVRIEDGVETVVEAFRALRSDGTDGPVVTFCHVGELGALNWFYASELAGLDNILLYPESLNGWTEAGGLLFVGKS